MNTNSIYIQKHNVCGSPKIAKWWKSVEFIQEDETVKWKMLWN